MRSTKQPATTAGCGNLCRGGVSVATFGLFSHVELHSVWETLLHSLGQAGGIGDGV